jgi:hypothetical protein
LAVPVAAAEDLISESPEAGRPLHSSRKPHNSALHCNRDSSRIPTTVAVGRFYRQIPHHSSARLNLDTSPNRHRKFLKKSFRLLGRFFRQSSSHS